MLRDLNKFSRNLRKCKETLSHNNNYYFLTIEIAQYTPILNKYLDEDLQEKMYKALTQLPNTQKRNA